MNARPKQPIFLSPCGFCFFIIRPEVHGLTGPFDENIWPAYCEDCEYLYRLHLARVPMEQTLPGQHLKDFQHGFSIGSGTLFSGTKMRNAIQLGQHLNCDYVKRKWNHTHRVQDQCGAVPGSAAHPYPFRHPFDNRSAGVRFWRMDWARRARLAQLFAYDLPDVYVASRRGTKAIKPKSPPRRK